MKGLPFQILFSTIVICSLIVLFALGNDVEDSRESHASLLNALMSKAHLPLATSPSPGLTVAINISSFAGISWANITVTCAKGRKPDLGDMVGLFLASRPPPGRAP